MMTLRKLLLIPLVISFILLVAYSPTIVKTASVVMSSIKFDAVFIFFISLSLIFQIIGHLLRSKKAVLLFSPIEQSKITTQLRAFAVGQLFNNILPLRIGELIRTAIISQKLNISYTYTFVLIIFERTLDLFIITALTGLAILLITGTIPSVVSVILVPLLLISGFGVGFIYTAKTSPAWFLKFIYGFTNLFNSHIKNLVRFKVWSLSYGLNKTLSKKVIYPYLSVTALMWMSYLVSVLFVTIALISDIGGVDRIVAALAPYIGIATPAGPAGLGVFSSASNVITETVSNANLTTFNIISWAMLLVPISVFGLFLLPKTAEPAWKKRRKGSSNESLANKIIRNEDVSSELEHFLESYFKGNDLSKIVSKLETEGEFNLVKYFRGGSDAITILTLRNKKRVVKKIIPINLKHRLKAQYDWLKKYGEGTIVRVSNEKESSTYYSIDIAYDDSSVPMFEYLHEIPIETSKRLLTQSWQGLQKVVYQKDGELVHDMVALEAYIDKHVFDCINKASEVDESIQRATTTKKLIINGVEYSNLYEIIKKIKSHPQAWADITTYTSTGVVHGDMIMDNILYSHKTKRTIIIDPAPDGNIVEGPVFDFGKAAQSLYCGYEFLLRDESSVNLKDNEISFNENKSLRFSELDLYMRNELAKHYLTEGERKAILFHAGVLFIRRLKHQVYYTPENALKFYAVGVRTLNDFLDQY